MFDKNLIFARYPELTVCQDSMECALSILINSISRGNKVLLCGNGGSAADCDHIAGELLKGFLKSRPLSEADKQSWTVKHGDDAWVSNKLQGGICAISLPGCTAPVSAISNDLGGDLTYAQLVWAMGQPGDVLICLSTSGEAKNVKYAAQTARQKQMEIICLTGKKNSALSDLADAAIQVPEQETFKVQELHLPVYHWICAALEENFF